MQRKYRSVHFQANTLRAGDNPALRPVCLVQQHVHNVADECGSHSNMCCHRDGTTCRRWAPAATRLAVRFFVHLVHKSRDVCGPERLVVHEDVCPGKVGRLRLELFVWFTATDRDHKRRQRHG